MGQSPKLHSITLGAMGMRVKHYCGSGQQARSKAGLTVRQSALIAHREIEMNWFKARDPTMAKLILSNVRHARIHF